MKATNTVELRTLAATIKVGTKVRICGYVSSQKLPDPLELELLPDDYAVVTRTRDIASVEEALTRIDIPEGLPTSKVRAYLQDKLAKLQKPPTPNAGDANLRPLEDGSKLYTDGESLYLLRCWSSQILPAIPKDPAAAWFAKAYPQAGSYVHKIKLSDLKFDSLEVL